jgi:hypothetical protein
MRLTNTLVAAAASGILGALCGCSHERRATDSAAVGAPGAPASTNVTVGALHSCKGPSGCKSDANSKHSCKGKNDCKGQGGCKTDKHGCKGQNDCKGQGGCAA